MIREEFKHQVEYPLNPEDVDFWKSIHIGATIERTLRLALQYPRRVFRQLTKSNNGLGYGRKEGR